MTVVLVSDPPQMVAAGGEITYTIHYTNHSLAPMAELTVAGMVPAGMVLVASTVPPTAQLVQQGNKQTIVWPLGDLAAQSGGTVSYRVQKSALTTPQRTELLALQVRSPLTATAGQPITYTLQLTNQRPFPLRNLVVVNELPAGATLDSAGGGEVVNQQVQWTIAQMAGASTTTLQWRVAANQSLVNAGAWVRVDGGPVVIGNTIITLIDGKVPAAAFVAIRNEGARISWRTNDAKYRLRSGALNLWVMP